ncbi:hypothetical protein PanWU01x14_056180 [Parasponia andersonii]|uniref:Uncharacterized protein n=1 Tax=Parasponia andersonii TaxID=3476 RepID=A0A2P5DKC6_PARAD|nr:hypothetical protein PanWU01x14_056180 [Parasponia andersonii]
MLTRVPKLDRIQLGSSYTVSVGTTSRPFHSGPNAINLEICCRWCGCGSCCADPINQSIDSGSSGSTIAWSLLGWCLDGEAQRTFKCMIRSNEPRR